MKKHIRHSILNKAGRQRALKRALAMVCAVVITFSLSAHTYFGSALATDDSAGQESAHIQESRAAGEGAVPEPHGNDEDSRHSGDEYAVDLMDVDAHVPEADMVDLPDHEDETDERAHGTGKHGGADRAPGNDVPEYRVGDQSVIRSWRP